MSFQTVWLQLCYRVAISDKLANGDASYNILIVCIDNQ